MIKCPALIVIDRQMPDRMRVRMLMDDDLAVSAFLDLVGVLRRHDRPERQGGDESR